MHIQKQDYVQQLPSEEFHILERITTHKMLGSSLGFKLTTTNTSGLNSTIGETLKPNVSSMQFSQTK